MAITTIVLQNTALFELDCSLADYIQMREWCKQYAVSKYWCMEPAWTLASGTNRYTLIFYDKSDALLFKLTWA